MSDEFEKTELYYKGLDRDVRKTAKILMEVIESKGGCPAWPHGGDIFNESLYYFAQSILKYFEQE